MLVSRIRALLLVSATFVVLLGLVSELATAQQNDAGTGGDAGNTFDTATLISTCQECMGDVDSSTDPADYYKFEVSKGQVVKFTESYGGSLTDGMEFAIFAPDKSLITTDSFAYSTAASSGYYYFKVTCGGGTANYTFEISVLGNPTVDTEEAPSGINLMFVVAGIVIIAVITGVIFVLRKRSAEWLGSAPEAVSES